MNAIKTLSDKELELVSGGGVECTGSVKCDTSGKCEFVITCTVKLLN